jgi:hypothetical protein
MADAGDLPHILAHPGMAVPLKCPGQGDIFALLDHVNDPASHPSCRTRHNGPHHGPSSINKRVNYLLSLKSAPKTRKKKIFFHRY